MAGPDIFEIEHNAPNVRSYVLRVETEFGAHLQHGRVFGQHIAIHASQTLFFRVIDAMLHQRQREAQKLILEGAMPWDVDRVIYDFGLPMGPFAMSDLAGLDIGWSKVASKSSTIREILCEMDRRGQKTSAGYYDYDEARHSKPSALVEKIILDFAAKHGIKRRLIADEEIRRAASIR